MRDPNVWRPWLINDQRFVSGRPDCSNTKRAARQGRPHHGRAADRSLCRHSGTDADFVVKLIR